MWKQRVFYATVAMAVATVFFTSLILYEHDFQSSNKQVVKAVGMTNSWALR